MGVDGNMNKIMLLHAQPQCIISTHLVEIRYFVSIKGSYNGSLHDFGVH